MKTTPARLVAWLSVICVATPLAAQSVAFVDVTVLPMDSDRTLARHTVIVKGDRIAEVGPTAQVKVPADAQRIDGAGKFLLPGLGEMHGHNPAAGSPPEMFENVFFLFVANGVTTVRSMLGFAGQLEWREKAKRGDILAPTLYLAGPSFSGQSAPSVEGAVERVRAQKTEGWDLLKIHPGLKVEVFDAIARTAREAGIEFSGHIPAAVGLVHAIEQGQTTVDHLDGYIQHLDAERAPVDRAKLAEVVKFTREKGTWVVPTMVLWEVIIGAAKPEVVAAYPELKYLPRPMVEGWKTNYARVFTLPNYDKARAEHTAANRKVLLKALADGGARIIFGTDAPQMFSVPGFSVHREMRAMAEAGMSNFAVLQTATRNVGEYLKAKDKFGVIAPGQRADLLLLNANPLADLGNVAKRSGVMVRGRWIAEAEIQARLEKIAATMAN